MELFQLFGKPQNKNIKKKNQYQIEHTVKHFKI